jgi:hypothetical protein
MQSKKDKESVVDMKKINDKLPKLTSTIEVRTHSCEIFNLKKVFLI